MSAEGLKLPEMIGGALDLRGLTSAEGLELSGSFTGAVYVNSLSVADVEVLRKKYPRVSFSKL